MRLAILASHPIQYQAPLFRTLAERLDLVVFFAHRASASDQAGAGYGVPFEWDVDVTGGFQHVFLRNVSRTPGVEHFSGCDTPDFATELAAGRFDALLVMGWHLKTYRQGIWAARRLRIPVMVRGDSQLATPRSALKRAGKAVVYPLALRAFDAALYVGERSREYWEHYRYPRSRLFFSPHCVDNDWFGARATPAARRQLRDRHAIGPDAPLVLLAGRLVEGKRPLDLIEACARLDGVADRPTLLVAGSGPLADAMTRHAEHHRVRLVHLGFCNQSEMPAAYAAADLLALPSGGETWGLVANEALACGRPIVVSDACGCAPDLVGDGAAGRVFPVADIAALASAVRALLVSPPQQATLAARIERYSLAAAAEGVIEAATTVTTTRARRSA